MSNLNLAKHRFNGNVKPLGDYDDHGRWYPSDFERCGCCSHIQEPSKNRPLTLLKHCRTLKHVENLIRKHKPK